MNIFYQDLKSAISLFKNIENKHDVDGGKDCMKKCCNSLRKHALKIFHFSKKTMKLTTNKQQGSYEKPKTCYICKETFENKYPKDRKYRKVRKHCHYTGKYGGAADSIFNLKFRVPKEIPHIFSQWM